MATRHNGKCKGCKKAHTALLTRRANVRMPDGRWVYAWRSAADALILARGSDNSAPLAACSCGKSVALRPVRGTYNPAKECNAKCMSACGQTCECSCGGRNHGAGTCAH